MSSLSDADLLRRYALSGDEVAFRTLVERFGGMVMAAALRQLENRTLAEEVVQTVFVQVARKATLLVGHGSLAGWLHRATHLECLKTRRGELRRRERETAAFYMNDPNAPAGSDWEALRPFLDEALDDLRGPEREALLLRFFHGRSFRDVGELLDIREDAAKMRVARAVKKLRGKLSKRGIGGTTSALALALSDRALAAPLPEMLTRSVTQHALSAALAPLAFSEFLSIIMSAKTFTLGIVMGFAVGGAWLTVATIREKGRGEETGPDPITFSTPAKGSGEKRVQVAGQPRPAQRGPGEVLAALRRLLTDPENESNRLDLRLLLAGLRPEEFGPLIDLIEREMTDGERRRVLPEVAAVWGAMDPAAAMGRMISCRSAHYKVTGEILARTIFGTWHAATPADARYWLVEHQDDAVFSEVIPGFISTMAAGLLENSEAAALSWSAELEGTDYRSAALQPLLARYTGQDFSADCSADLGRLYHLFSGHADASFAQDGLRALAKSWARSRPEEWTRFLETLTPGSGAWDAALAALSAGNTVRVSQGRERMILLLESREEFRARIQKTFHLAVGLTPSEAAAEIVRHSTRSTFALRDWALPLLSGPEKGAAILAAVGHALTPVNGYVGDEGPNRMALEWAAEHPDPAVRDPLVYGLYQNWLMRRSRTHENPDEFPGRREWAAPLRAILEKAESEL